MIMANNGNPMKITGMRYVSKAFLDIVLNVPSTISRSDEKMPRWYFKRTVNANVRGRANSQSPALDDLL